MGQSGLCPVCGHRIIRLHWHKQMKFMRFMKCRTGEMKTPVYLPRVCIAYSSGEPYHDLLHPFVLYPRLLNQEAKLFTVAEPM